MTESPVVSYAGCGMFQSLGFRQCPFVWDKFPCHVYVGASICGCSNHLEPLCGWNRLPNSYIQLPCWLVAVASCLLVDQNISKPIRTRWDADSQPWLFWWSTPQPWYAMVSWHLYVDVKTYPSNSSHFKRSPTRRKPQQVSCPGRDSFVRLVKKSGNNYRKHSPSPFHGKMPWVSCRVSLKIIH
jgi:hypothetical protein